MEIRTRTVHVVDQNVEVGKVTIAYTIKSHGDGLGQDGAIEASFAFCSPKDQFNRKTGKLIAVGRLLKGKKFVTVPYDREQSILFNLREALVAYARVVAVKWMDTITVEDLR
jgi:hypothetical protein